MANRFRAGQVWRARCRPQDDNPHIIVLGEMEAGQGQSFYSIAITGVRIANPGMKGGVQTELPHAPVTEEVLGAAVLDLVASDGPTAADPEYSEAYEEYMEEYKLGEAGVFTIPVAEILDIIEQFALSQEE